MSSSESPAAAPIGDDDESNQCTPKVSHVRNVSASVGGVGYESYQKHHILGFDWNWWEQKRYLHIGEDHSKGH